MKNTSKKVLVVDDDEMVLNAICMMLDVLGYEAFRCLNSNEAIEAYQSMRESGRRFDSVLLDLNMGPYSHDGISTLLLLREIDVDVNAACSTGSINETDKLLEIGFSHVFAKPFGMDELRCGMESICA